jgi:hypothetical protein
MSSIPDRFGPRAGAAVPTRGPAKAAMPRTGREFGACPDRDQVPLREIAARSFTARLPKIVQVDRMVPTIGAGSHRMGRSPLAQGF